MKRLTQRQAEAARRLAEAAGVRNGVDEVEEASDDSAGHAIEVRDMRGGGGALS